MCLLHALLSQLLRLFKEHVFFTSYSFQFVLCSKHANSYSDILGNHSVC